MSLLCPFFGLTLSGENEMRRESSWDTVALRVPDKGCIEGRGVGARDEGKESYEK